MGDEAKPKGEKGSWLGTAFKGVSVGISLLFVGYFGYTIYNGTKPPAFPGYASSMKTETPQKVALIPIDRTLSSISSGSSVGSDDIITLINRAEADGADNYIFEINSGGGAVLPSKEIMERVRELSKGNYTIAIIRDVGASGAYWIASACDDVIADETSLVGSIGVRMDYLEFSGLMEKLGIGYVDVHSGDRKTMGSPFKKLSEEEKNILEDIVKEAHMMFISSVAENREMKYEDVEKLATGQIFTGKMSKENGLVDYLGGRKEASQLMDKKIGNGFEIYVYYVKAPQSLFGGLLSTFGHAIGEGLAEGIQDDKGSMMKYRTDWAE